MLHTSTRLTALALAVACSTAALTACGSDDADTTKAESTSTATTTTPAASSSAAAESSTSDVTFEDAWAKATDGKMTGVFGTLKNAGTDDVVISGGKSPAAGMLEMHEVVSKDGKKVMQEKESGHVVKAGSELVLKPGADHIMLMNMPKPIKAGDEIKLTLTTTSGGSLSFDVPVRDSGAGAEPYEGDGEHSHEHGDHDKDEHGDHDHSSSPTTSS